jgi:hypothetical protein
MGHFKGYFEGAKTFLTPKLSREMAHYVGCPKQKKKEYPKFSKIGGALVFLCPFATRALNFIILYFNFIIFLLFYCFNKDMWRKPREISQIVKKSAKVYHSLYSSSEQLQVALRTFMFFKLG